MGDKQSETSTSPSPAFILLPAGLWKMQPGQDFLLPDAFPWQFQFSLLLRTALNQVIQKP